MRGRRALCDSCGQIDVYFGSRKPSALSFAARASAAGLLTLALLSAGAAAGLSGARELCEMECCVGLAPHAAGSCSAGSCHVDFSAVGADGGVGHGRGAGQSPGQSDPVCDPGQAGTSGQPPGHARKGVGNKNSSKGGVSKSEGRRAVMPAVSAASLSRPCAPGCGAAGSGCSHPRRGFDPAALAAGVRARPPNAPSTLTSLSATRPRAARRPDSSRSRGPPQLS